MIERLLLYLVGYGMVVGLIGAIWKCNARRWTRLARAYGVSNAQRGNAQRIMQTVILVGGDLGWNSYKGIVTVGVTSEGISLRLMPPFSIFHPPLLIPYSDLNVEPRKWYLNCESFQYSPSEVSDARIIVDDELYGWIESQYASLTVAAESVGSR